MNALTKKLLAIFALISLTGFVACDDGDETRDDNDSMETELTIPEVAAEAGDFETLLTAVQAADLAETLSGDGPFTVFAPTDAAFAALPEGTVEALLDDIPALTNILLFHVVGDEVRAEDVMMEDFVTTLQGSDAMISIGDDGVAIENAMIVVTDIEASNGVIHVIDAVILPPEE